METYIVKQPVVNSNHQVVAYEILYRQDESSLYNKQDVWVANAIEHFLGEMSDDKFLGGKTVFLTFTPNLLMRNIPKMFDSKKLVIQVEDNSIIHPVAQKIIYRFKKQGYKIAIKDFEFLPRYFGIMDAVDIVKIDFLKSSTSLENIVNLAHSFEKQVSAYNINTPEALELAIKLKCDYMQGAQIGIHKKSKVHRFDHIQSNFFQLMVAVTNEEPDVDEITRIISRDVTLAFSLMKLVNSAYFGLTNQVKSVQQALVVLGMEQLKQWIYLLSFRDGSGDMQDELIKTSFQRAMFCKNLASIATTKLPISASEAYMMGMFSTLETLMEVPLEDALYELPISEHIKAALIKNEGICADLYNLVLSYERADWGKITAYAEALGIPQNNLTQIYFDCVENVNEIWQDLDTPAQNEAK